MKGRCYGFHQHGRRNSYPRQVILDLLFQNKTKHFSAKEIYEHLLKKGIYIGIASIYRNLELLSDLGVIKKYNFDKGELKYQIADEEQEHHHIVCPNRIIDFSLDSHIKTQIQELKKQLEKKYNINITNYELKFFATPKDNSHE